MAKCKAVIKQNYIDDIELDEEGVAEMLMDENALASMPRYMDRSLDHAALIKLNFFFMHISLNIDLGRR
jgi:hypothetical protein